MKIGLVKTRAFLPASLLKFNLCWLHISQKSKGQTP